MKRPKTTTIRSHEDPALFVEALNFTAAETRFAARLIEKDYFCSLVLDYLAGADETLVFKGGTCLTKVYVGFYRLSEDLDFVIPTPVEATRQERSRRAAGVKQAMGDLSRALPGLLVIEALKGANSSKQYLGAVAYQSLLSRQQETITIEIGLREPLLKSQAPGSANTILLDPVSHQPMVAPVRPRCISKEEAFAEKFRAALSRRDAAIRDFYDIDYAIGRLGLQLRDKELGLNALSCG